MTIILAIILFVEIKNNSWAEKLIRDRLTYIFKSNARDTIDKIQQTVSNIYYNFLTQLNVIT